MGGQTNVQHGKKVGSSRQVVREGGHVKATQNKAVAGRQTGGVGGKAKVQGTGNQTHTPVGEGGPPQTREVVHKAVRVVLGE